jgi:hypothetical protein
MERFNRFEMETVDRLRQYASVTTVEMQISERVSQQFWIINGRKKMAFRIKFNTESCRLNLIPSDDCSLDAPEVKIFNKIMLVVKNGETRLEAFFLGIARPDKDELMLAGDTSAEELVETIRNSSLNAPKALPYGTAVEFVGIIENINKEFIGNKAFVEAYVLVNGKSFRVLLIAKEELAEALKTSNTRISGKGICVGKSVHSDIDIELKGIEFRA